MARLFKLRPNPNRPTLLRPRRPPTPARTERTMANTTTLKDNPALRKALKRATRRKLKATDKGLTHALRDKLRRARKEKHVGLRSFLAKIAKDAAPKA